MFVWTNEYHYNLRYNAKFLQPLVNSVCSGAESVSNLGPKIWNTVLDAYKNIGSIKI